MYCIIVYLRQCIIGSSLYILCGDLVEAMAVTNVYQETVQVMFWNIFEGGKSKISDIKKYVSSTQEMDVVGFSELNGWNKANFHNYFNDKYPYSVFLKTKTGYHLGAISKKPIKVIAKSNDSPMHHGFIYFESFKYKIMITHLSPHSSVKRLEEVVYLLNLVNRTRDDTNNDMFPFLMMGDFNTLSNIDVYDQVKVIDKLFRNEQTRKKFFDDNNVTTNNDLPEIDYKPYTYLINNDMFDTGKSGDYTVPTPVNSDYMHAALLRLDYIFCNKFCFFNDKRNVINSIVHKNIIVENLSDHFPISISLPLKKENAKEYNTEL